MEHRTRIEIETAKHLTVSQELLFVRLAYDRNPNRVMRLRLATLLLVCDAFDDLVALLAPHDDLDFTQAMLLVQAHLARETPEDSRQARRVADHAFSEAGSDAQRAAALAARGKAETRLGDIAAARATLGQALRLDPREKDACKRLAALDLAANDPAAVLAMADSLTAQGAAHARLFAARALAHAKAGAIDVARAAAGLDDLSAMEMLAPPPGWDDIHAFNAALAEELLAHPGLRYERYGTASALTWRIDSPATRKAPLVRLLLAQIADAIDAHLDRIDRVDHPWARARPASAVLRSWCVITESAGFETWHVHQFGWLSGVYYVRVPDSIAQGDRLVGKGAAGEGAAGLGGCLAFGMPGELIGDEAASAFGTRIVRPRDGLMLAFPSHSYHRTFPHGLGEKRICIAFDLRPT
ncbi:putative 2-oxoglutarate-Fe(II)-dependent oxygenase superfamily protein [Sphingomonas aurantiaca]|uniref:Putative 2-oxoglutarate-Fe(II)-dependent oxygenase superfamily protein n=1 Tax=Sphingomonas aurantiaca TaxID=185949 RepID=A0A2T5GGA1_9SPHN|nr:putative 2OG-Fe(II) oxygenase [Sphingomonas aurantiaca]PTQ58338.1 putative 2-oxoglutarate-Fe(II)-dependent oxygenase superfamily protein [Sphingomonas aurantiaca]